MSLFIDKFKNMNKEFLSITTPYNSEDYKIMNKVISEGFSKSKFQKSATDNSKAVWSIHESELPSVYSKLKQLFDKTGNLDYISLKDDISKIALSENMIGCTSDEKTEEDDFFFNEAELMEMINSSVSENSSDSLANKHGENLKPETLDETTDTERYEDVIFMQGEEADEAMEIMNNEGKDAAMEYLKQWHQPGNHMGRNEPGHGNQDKTYSKDGYIMAWNPYLPYIGLTYDTEYAGQEEIAEDSLTLRHLAGQREKDAPLGQHAPHSQATIKEQGDDETKLVYSGF